MITEGQSGRCPTQPKVGDKWQHRVFAGRAARIMAIAEGYVMVRYKGTIPFVESVKTFVKDFQRKP